MSDWPTNYAVYAATCDPARGKGCLGSPTGLTAKELQYTGVSSAYAVAVGTGVNTYTTVTANINKHNAADPKGLVSSAFAYIVVDGSGQMRCGSNDYETGINPDFNIVTGAQIPIGYSPASDRWLLTWTTPDCPAFLQGEDADPRGEHAQRSRLPGDLKSAEKGGLRSIRPAMMRARRAKARSGISSSIRKAC